MIPLQPSWQLSTTDGAACRWVKSRLGDADGGVREVASEVVGTLAANYHAVKQMPLPTTHMLFKMVLDSLSVKKEQVAAGMALHRMAPHVGALNNALLKQLIKLMSGAALSFTLASKPVYSGRAIEPL
jgi:hypothetical protein